MTKYQNQQLHSVQISPTSSKGAQYGFSRHGVPPKACPVPPGPYRYFWHPNIPNNRQSPMFFSFHIPAPLPQAALPCRLPPVGSCTLSAGFSGKSVVKRHAAGREDINQYSTCLVIQTRPWKHSAFKSWTHHFTEPPQQPGLTFLHFAVQALLADNWVLKGSSQLRQLQPWLCMPGIGFLTLLLANQAMLKNLKKKSQKL